MIDTVTLYQQRTRKFAIYPKDAPLAGITYCSLGLAGEVGEVLNQVKKCKRDDDNTLTTDRLNKLHDELGDVCWYLSQLCNELGFELSDVMMQNINKLERRRKEGTIQGDKRTPTGVTG